MRTLHLENVPEAGARLPVGGYVCQIVQVEDMPAKEYLKISYDITEGRYGGHYSQLYASRGFWGGLFIKSYKENALPFFKAFLEAVSASNGNFPYDGKVFSNEQALMNMYVGIVLAEKQYRANDGSIKTQLYDVSLQSVQSIRDGNYTIPDLKLLAPSGGIPTDPFAQLSSSKNPFIGQSSAASQYPAGGQEYQGDDDLPF